MHAYRLFAPLLLLLALSGCSMTLFEALPPGTATQCAPTWPGHWVKVKSPSHQTTAEAEDEVEVEEIDANCSDVNKAGSGKPAPVTLISTPDGRQYIEFMGDPGKPSCQPGQSDKERKRCGHMLLRYEDDGNAIRVFDIDHDKVASLIRKKKIRGETEQMPLPEGSKPDKPIHFNLVAGDAAQIDKLLKANPDLFLREPIMTLRRATPEEIAADKAREAAAASKPQDKTTPP